MLTCHHFCSTEHLRLFPRAVLGAEKGTRDVPVALRHLVCGGPSYPSVAETPERLHLPRATFLVIA